MVFTTPEPIAMNEVVCDVAMCNRSISFASAVDKCTSHQLSVSRSACPCSYQNIARRAAIVCMECCHRHSIYCNHCIACHIRNRSSADIDKRMNCRIGCIGSTREANQRRKAGSDNCRTLNCVLQAWAGVYSILQLHPSLEMWMLKPSLKRSNLARDCSCPDQTTKMRIRRVAYMYEAGARQRICSVDCCHG